MIKGDINVVEGIVDMAADIVLDGTAAQIVKDGFKTGVETVSEGEFKPTGIITTITDTVKTTFTNSEDQSQKDSTINKIKQNDNEEKRINSSINEF
jgi:hypothetical protein